MLEHFFGSKTRLKLLKIFFRNPEQSFYVRELARLLDTQLNAVRREIANLEQLGIIAHVEAAAVEGRETGTERSKYFRLNTASMLFTELKALLIKAEVLEEQHLVDHIKNKAGKLKLFLLTGQFVQEDEVGTDMLLVGQIKPVALAKIIKSYEEEVGRTVRYTIMDEREFKDRREIGDRFLYSIFEAKHILAINEYHLG